MTGFATVDALCNAITVNVKKQTLYFDKLFAAATATFVPHTSWTATGNPQAGAYGTTGVGNGRVLTSSTAGAMVYGNATGPATMHLITAGVTTKVASSTGTLILCDRIADCAIAQTAAAASFTGVDATSRLASTTAPGDGGQLWVEISSTLTGAANKTLTYTDQLGNASATTPALLMANTAVGRSGNLKLWQDLAAGDSGLRSLDTIATTTGGTSGNICCCIVRPLATIPIPAVSVWVEKDYVIELPNIPLLYDSSCLFWIYIPTAAVTPSIFGEIRICEN
jgi:hypothetical protein